MPRLELSDMLVALRQELEEAQAKAAEEDLKFNVESIDVEAQVTVSKEGEVAGKAKWKFWIFSEAEVGAVGKAGKETVQTIRLKLTPTGSLEISGQAEKPSR